MISSRCLAPCCCEMPDTPKPCPPEKCSCSNLVLLDYPMLVAPAVTLGFEPLVVFINRLYWEYYTSDPYSEPLIEISREATVVITGESNHWVNWSRGWPTVIVLGLFLWNSFIKDNAILQDGHNTCQAWVERKTVIRAKFIGIANPNMFSTLAFPILWHQIQFNFPKEGHWLQVKIPFLIHWKASLPPRSEKEERNRCLYFCCSWFHAFLLSRCASSSTHWCAWWPFMSTFETTLLFFLNSPKNLTCKLLSP